MGASQSSSSNNNSSSDITRNNDASASSLTSTTFTTSSSSAKNTDRQLQQQLSEPAADVDMPTTTSDILMTSTPPPQLGRMESFDEKLWRKVRLADFFSVLVTFFSRSQLLFGSRRDLLLERLWAHSICFLLPFVAILYRTHSLSI
jgi:hypothetical protein